MIIPSYIFASAAALPEKTEDPNPESLKRERPAQGEVPSELQSMIGDEDTSLELASMERTRIINGREIILPPKDVLKPILRIDYDRNRKPIPITWTVEDIITNIPPPIGWERVFQESRNELVHISNLLKTMGPYYPKREHLFRAFEKTPLDAVRVILIGQDPYHQTKKGSSEPRAQGLSFSFARDDPVPGNSSLHNMFLELQNCYPATSSNPFRYPSHGDLSHWAEQGVLLLNTCLTVAPGKALSHMGGSDRSEKNLWGPFLARVLLAINQRENTIASTEGIKGTLPAAAGPTSGGKTIRVKPIYVLLGGKAQKLKHTIGGYCEKVIILEATHPSGLSAERGFFGSKIFWKINKELRQMGQPEIDWNLPD
jgi:uracil-DNA glycosylase